MGRRRVEEKEIRFDPKARVSWVTGFHKRKEERRRQAVREELETDRNERIALRKEIRDDIRMKWKWAQRLYRCSDKLLALEDMKARGQEIEDEEDAEVQRALDNSAGKPVAFDQEEDDDAFGNCEVVTTVVSAPALTNGVLSLPEQMLWPAVLQASGTLCRAEMTDEELDWRRRKRYANIARQEVLRKKNLEKKVSRMIKLHDRIKKKRKNKGKKRPNRISKIGFSKHSRKRKKKK